MIVYETEEKINQENKIDKTTPEGKYTVEQYYAKGDWMLTVYNSGSIARVFNGKQRK
jgi:hypothetical protein